MDIEERFPPNNIWLKNYMDYKLSFLSDIKNYYTMNGKCADNCIKYAIYSDNVPKVKELLENGVNPDGDNYYIVHPNLNHSSIQLAYDHHNYLIIMMLIEAGASLDHFSFLTFKNIMEYAMFYNSQKVFEKIMFNFFFISRLYTNSRFFTDKQKIIVWRNQWLDKYYSELLDKIEEKYKRHRLRDVKNIIKSFLIEN